MSPAPASSAAVEAPSPSRVGTDRILFAFNARERGIFLPEFRLEEFAAWPHAWLDTEHVGAGDWDKKLRDWRPTVIVTAWSAKRIPAAWAASGEMSLRYVCHVTGSLRGVLTRDLLERGVRATNWGSVINHAVAEHALLLALGLLRGAPCWPASIVAGGWTLEQSARLRTKTLRGRRVGLHGFGAIAREIIGLLAPFRPSEVLAYSHGVPPSLIAEHGATPCPNLDELFSRSEVLIGCESLSPQNRGSVDARVLSRLADDSVFVNVGRGAIVDEAALLHEAESGRLRIGTDVYHHEPPPPDYPLLRLPGVLASPHIAGPTSETYRLCGDHALENLRRYLAGKPLEGEISPAGFDRMT